jgi:hypothetical protein
MQALQRHDLMTLEDYSQQRAEFRERVMKHKRHRRFDVGPNLTFYFEDRLTMQYQVQEMLRIERIFEDDAIKEELDTYNALIPDGRNLKATVMLEFEDEAVRRQRLSELVGIEHDIYTQVEGHEKIMAIANEDLERSTSDKTSAVHFMRFEYTADMISSLRAGARLYFGSDHEHYHQNAAVSTQTHASLLKDFDNGH